MNFFKSLLPKSLTSRILAMLSILILTFLTAGLGLFYKNQLLQHIEEIQDTANMLIEVAAQAVEESVVIGDYDTIKRTLEKTLARSPFKSAMFIDLSGGVIRLEAASAPVGRAPAWIESEVAARLFDVNRPITIGGKDYGVMRLSFNAERIAAELYSLVIQATLFAVFFLLISLMLMGFMIKRSLAHLGKLHSYEAEIASGAVAAEAMLVADAPMEIQEAIKAVNRTAASMRNHFGLRIESLMNTLVQHKNALDEVSIVCEVSASGRITYVNERFVTSSQHSRAELLELTIDEVWTGMSSTTEPWQWAPENEVWNGEVRLSGRSGKVAWHRRTIIPILDDLGGVEKYICIDIDITDRKEFEVAILDNSRRQNLIALFGQQALTEENVSVLGERATLTAAQGLNLSKAALRVIDRVNHEVILSAEVGFTDVEIRSGYHNDFLSGTAASVGFFINADAPDSRYALLPGETVDVCNIRSGLEVDISCREVFKGVLGVYASRDYTFTREDVSYLQTLANLLAAALERYDAKRKLTYLAENDSLTHLPNRWFLSNYLREIISRTTSAPDAVSVIFIDLDRFKAVNDTMGHSVGDQLLIQAGRRLKGCMDENSVVARLGGDEFSIVVTHNVYSESLIKSLATHVVDALGKPFNLGGQDIFVSASVGIANYPFDGRDTGVILKNADTAMYHAKKSGRNNFKFYNARMNESLTRRLQTETLLRGALDRDEFILHFQPKVSLADGRISGLEALLRWNHPEQGMISPADFIPILEDTGLIIPVGVWVIRKVCETLKSWEENNIRLVPIAINLSVRQLQVKGLAETVKHVVEAYGINPALLEFELTESMLMIDPESAVEILRDIKSYGISLSVDDFGTGYSSLAYLKRFPLDALKIDRAFIKDITSNHEDAAITRAVIVLAHELGLKVIAEGVETVDQLELLVAYGCDQMQGYLFSKPVISDECAAMIKSSRSLDIGFSESGVA
ncbi:putative bifunctional diguanylate cyclase/phosphodiesterase [Pseudomonas syringae]|uniref:cyclic-guanylate-specific phosphodiesterase n=1 Tax=Pseudomonas syringae Cit 7 TaxID=629264 RepID=A0A8T8LVG8_PSESX|nr:EAL domain-containing protein [Pseudomonas syringae]MCK9717918.1 EAL domain-containing protein [Pseudomonas syringae pv. syringae]MCK9763339.1 EAL domain-containing protein [Pseudomonas syringae pv. syringae]MCK9777538.1 EAL domain-containing protein [Pseudomonas syringae pv. syringae]NAO27077.1 EAL domain-containing protein [Pseudomonas syringae pv. dysoxyli]PBP77526.1 GGDEF domain-containing protein [Pseudomonas syringae]